MAEENKINPSTGNLDKIGQTISDISENDLRYLKLDGSNANTTINIGSQNLTTTGTISSLSGTFSSLTSGRVPFVSTAGLLTDSSKLTYDSATPRLITWYLFNVLDNLGNNNFQVTSGYPATFDTMISTNEMQSLTARTYICAGSATTAGIVMKYLSATDTYIGINTTSPDRHLEINDDGGECLRLTYNDANGTAANYSDFLVGATGDLTITASGGDISFDNENLLTTGTLGAGAITGTSFIIGANTLTTSEWAFLDGQDQAVKTTDNVTFNTVKLASIVSDPGSPADGLMWYRSDLDELRVQINSATYKLTVSPV